MSTDATRFVDQEKNTFGVINKKMNSKKGLFREKPLAVSIDVSTSENKKTIPKDKEEWNRKKKTPITKKLPNICNRMSVLLTHDTKLKRAKTKETNLFKFKKQTSTTNSRRNGQKNDHLGNIEEFATITLTESNTAETEDDSAIMSPDFEDLMYQKEVKVEKVYSDEIDKSQKKKRKEGQRIEIRITCHI